MPAPSSSLSTLRPELAGSMEEFDLAMDRQGFIGLRVLPALEVTKSSGTFGKIPLESLLQNREGVRNVRGGYNRSDYQFDSDTFSTTEYGFEEPIDDKEVALYEDFFDVEILAAERARDALLRAYEKRVAAAIFNTTTWTGASLTTAITNEWDDATNATPIVDVEAAVKKVWDGTGLWPNALVINRRVFRNLRNCDEIVDRIASSGAGSPTKPADITVAQLAACFDLPYILVAGSAKSTAIEGQSASISPIWSDEYAMVCRIAESQDIREPCIGRTFHWIEDRSSIGGTMESYRDESIRADIVRDRHQTGEKILYSAAGHLLSNVTT